MQLPDPNPLLLTLASPRHHAQQVPYHGWRVSHRTHHANHGHVENDESWHPVTKKLYDGMVGVGGAVWGRYG